jgi:hypothetical protein
MDCKLEVVQVPVTDVDRAKRFYSEQVGFAVDLDTRISDEVRIVQLTSTTYLQGGWRACSSSCPTSRPLGLNWSSGVWKPARFSTWTAASGLRGEAESGTRSSSSAIRTVTAGFCRSVPLAIS